MVKPNFESRLISFVRSHKELYDPKVRKDRAIVNRIWERAATVLNSDENYCRNRWRSLRNHYRKIKIKIQAHGGNQNYITKWRHFDEMSFIDPYLVSTDKFSIVDDDQSQDNVQPVLKFEDHLVNLVRQYEFIYNKDHRLFHQRAATREAWVEIGEKLNSDPTTCRQQWLIQRSCYQKLKKKINDKGGLSKFIPKWRLFSKMSFLDEWDSINILPDSDQSPLDENDESMESISGGNFPNQGHSDEIHDEDNLSLGLSLSNAEILSEEIIIPENKLRSKTNLRRRKKNIVHRNTTSEESEMEENEVQINKIQQRPNTTTRGTVDSSCGTYFSMLGMKIDEMPVPPRVRYDLERRITHLVYDVLKTYS